LDCCPATRRNATQQSATALGIQELHGVTGALGGHIFHYSHIETPPVPTLTALNPATHKPGEALYRNGSIIATYLHGYWPSNPAFAVALVGAMPILVGAMPINED
jgi:cobyrinic acid a,c-diamide synthase